jgi:hypothetical protein
MEGFSERILDNLLETEGRDFLVSGAQLLMNCSHIRFAKSRGRLHQRVEHGPQIEGRAADDLEHVGGRGLLLQRFAQFVEQRVFSMAMTACLAKLTTSSICFSLKGRTSWRNIPMTPISVSSLSIGTKSAVR